jgi:hypothetical protein
MNYTTMRELYKRNEIRIYIGNRETLESNIWSLLFIWHHDYKFTILFYHADTKIYDDPKSKWR